MNELPQTRSYVRSWDRAGEWVGVGGHSDTANYDDRSPIGER